MKNNILIVDDEQAVRLGYSKYLKQRGYNIYESSCLTEAKQEITSRRHDAILLDLRLPDGNGLEWIQELRDSYQHMAIIVITASDDVSIAVEAMRRGANNYLVKPINMAELDLFLQKSIESEALKHNVMVQKRLKKKSDPFFGESPAMTNAKGLISMASESDAPVLLLGETGTGKTVFAQNIHEQSIRNSGPFVDVNCSTLTGNLLERELFGHVKGSFTSAVKDSPGLIESADGGTLFLDEICNMDISIQAKFLHVLENKQYRRIGDIRNRYSDFRLICATNQDIQEAVRDNRFRNDLYFRINVLSIVIPPLRERKDDLPNLIGYLLKNMLSSPFELSPELLELLKSYYWPGNIRELKNMLERALIFSRNGPLQMHHFSGLQSLPSAHNNVEEALELQEIEKKHILDILKQCGGDKQKAAEKLGVSRATLYRKLKKSHKNQ